MSPRNLAWALGPFSRAARLLTRRRRVRPAARRLGTEPLEPRAMLSTTATLGFDAAAFTRIPVTFRRPDGTVGSSTTAYVGQLSWSGMTGEAATVGVPASFTSFCIEGLQGVAPGRNTFATIGPAAGSPLLGADRAELLADFWRQYGPTDAAGFADKTDSAAFQLGVWELINDGRPVRNAATNPLAAGQFSVGATGLTTQAAVRARQWLDGLDSAAPGRTAVALYAVHSPTRQDQVVAVPIVDLDVDGDNTGVVDRSAAEETAEKAGVTAATPQPTGPGLIVPVGGNRVQMVVDVPRGRTARLEFTADVATRARVWTNAGAEVLSGHTVATPIHGGDPSIFWIGAFAPSTNMADLVFTLTTSDGGPVSSDTIRGTAVAVDLDVDSDNDGTIDPDNGPTGSDDQFEGDATQGLVLAVLPGDADRDRVPDNSDFDDILGPSFTPIQVNLSAMTAAAWRPLTPRADGPQEFLPGLEFTFTFPDAGLEFNGGDAAGEPRGAFRLWTKDAYLDRTAAHLVRSGRPIRALDLLAAQPRPRDLIERVNSFGRFTLYLEAIVPTETFQPITVSMGGAGAWRNAVTTDVVHVRVLEPAIDLDVDSNNDNGFERPDRSPWEEKLERHAYGLGKLVMQSSTDPFHRSESPTLAHRFTPVVIALPKNLPIFARTLEVRFDWEEHQSGGDLWLWVRDMSPDLDWRDASPGPNPWLKPGDRIRRGGSYPLSVINYNPTTGEALVYMDGYRPTDRVTLNDVETRGGATASLIATLTCKVGGRSIDLGADSVKYIVVRDDFFYRDFQTRPEVRSALASRAVYEFADTPNFSLNRLPEDRLREMLGAADVSEIRAMLFTDKYPNRYPGFKAVLYQDFAAREDNAFVLAFAGTDDSAGEFIAGKGFDWAENVCQALGWDSFQYQYAMLAATTINEARRQIPGATLLTTGHSLGGGLASAASIVTGARGITFNAAGLNKNTLHKFTEDSALLDAVLQRYNKPEETLEAFHVDFDFLTTVQFLGSTFGFPTAIGKSHALDGPYDMEATAAFVTAVTLPGVSGVLGTVWLVSVEVRAHLMPAVLYGLLVDEGIATRTRDRLGYDLTRF